MRFVHTPTLQLVYRRDDDIPPYAILSHTWGPDDDEVTLQDMQQLIAALEFDPDAFVADPIAQRPGFIKIQGAARHALSEGHEFIWIDTCCIDKTSSTELSEAINSMFRWYEESEVCYVFVDDIDVNNDATLPGCLDVELCSKIKACRWFSRGWTLQELIAPADVRFYSKGWVHLGSKTGDEPFLGLISDITGIDQDALNKSQDLEDFSIAARMKWASQRRTTRIEDIAYCLMGIFNVNMPLLYGEGHKAFMRLQEEIFRSTDDQSLFAWKSPEDNLLKDQPEGAAQPHGLLAKHPLWFQNSGHFRNLPANAAKSAPSSITNVGLHVQFSLHPLKDGDQGHEKRIGDTFAAILQCSAYQHEDESDRAIYKPALELQYLGGDRYARINCERILDMDLAQLDPKLTGSSYEYIYVQQKPKFKIPDICVNDVDLDGKLDFKYQLTPLWYPKGQWDKSTKTLRCTRTGSNGLLCVFRYSYEFMDNRLLEVDILVVSSYRSSSSGPSNYLCFQQPATGQPWKGQSYDYQSLWSFHRHGGISASIELDERNEKYRGLTLTLRIVSPMIFHIENKLCVISGTPEISKSTKTDTDGHWISDYLSNLSQDDDFSTGFFQKEYIRTERRSKLTSSPATNVRGQLSNCKAKEFTFVTGNVGKRLSFIEEKEPRHRGIVGLFQAVIDGKVKTVQSILESVGIEGMEAMLMLRSFSKLPWTSGFQLLHWAVFAGHQRTVHALIGCDDDVRTRFEPVNAINHPMLESEGQSNDATELAPDWLTTVHIAAMLGHIPILQELLEGAEQDWNEVLSRRHNLGGNHEHPLDSPFHLAAAHVRSPKVREVFECMREVAQPNTSGEKSSWINCHRNGLWETPLHRAAAMDNTHAISAILSYSEKDKDQDIECIDAKKRTPLWHAAATGSYAAMLLLLKQGANANAWDHVGMTVLQAACRSANLESIRALLSSGADPNLCAIVKSPSQGLFACMTTCLLAALKGSATTLRTLLDAGAKIDGTHESNMTPLHIAAANGNVDFVKILCEEYGHIVHLKTPYLVQSTSEQPGIKVEVFAKGMEKTALELATLCKRHATERFLRRFIAKKN